MDMNKTKKSKKKFQIQETKLGILICLKLNFIFNN